MPAFFGEFPTSYFAVADALRRVQANTLGVLGLGPRECDYRIINSGPYWRLRDYSGPRAAPSLLIVAAPIKRPYIWDLVPSASAIRYCLGHGLHVYLLEWMPPTKGNGGVGLDEYAGEAIATSVATIEDATQGTRPFLIGHSLGGTLAAIFCACEPLAAKGLVLLGAPLCFAPASSRFRDALASFASSPLSETDIVAGSLLSQISAAASPATFLWSRWKDAALSLGDPAAIDLHARVERWSLDEVALPAKLVNQILQLLYRENRLCRGTLSVRGQTIGPGSQQVPTLAVVVTADEIGPLASVAPFVDKMAGKDASILEYPGEAGVVLQHLGILVGRQAYSRLWPQIIAWIKTRA